MRPDLRYVEQRLNRILASASGLLPEEELRQMCTLVAMGEPRVAPEHFFTQLHEYDVTISEEMAGELGAVAAAMGMPLAWRLNIHA